MVFVAIALAKGTQRTELAISSMSLQKSVTASCENMVAKARLSGAPWVSMLEMYVRMVKMNMDIQKRVKKPCEGGQYEEKARGHDSTHSELIGPAQLVGGVKSGLAGGEGYKGAQLLGGLGAEGLGEGEAEEVLERVLLVCVSSVQCWMLMVASSMSTCPHCTGKVGVRSNAFNTSLSSSSSTPRFWHGVSTTIGTQNLHHTDPSPRRA